MLRTLTREEAAMMLRHLDCSSRWLESRPPLPTLSFEVDVLNNILSALETVQQCELPESLDDALGVIPHERLAEMATAEVAETGVPYEYALVHALLKWFKNDFFQWVGSLKCPKCPPNAEVFHSAAEPIQDELNLDPKMSKVELHICAICGYSQRFPRYRSPQVLLQTRRGRCGEYVACFLLLCRALGLEARYLVDFADHVWLEVWLNAPPLQGTAPAKRWVHADPSEGLLDAPMVYYLGWKKPLRMVVAVHHMHCADVSARYIDPAMIYQKSESLKYRMAMICAYGLTQVPPEKKFDALWPQVVDTEELAHARTASAAEMQSRQSGDAQWRQQRGEDGLSFPVELSDFKPLSISQAIVVGSAEVQSESVQLTPDEKSQSGAVWWEMEKIGDMAIEFELEMGTIGADGAAFVMQAMSSTALGRDGSGLGYAEIARSVAVEFDTFYSVHEHDRCDNHVGIQASKGPNTSSHRQSRAVARYPLRMANGKPFRARVCLISRQLSVWACARDSEAWTRVTQADVDVAAILGTTETFWIGFTASTGGLHQRHLVRNVLIARK